jgi:hypothetical protein
LIQGRPSVYLRLWFLLCCLSVAALSAPGAANASGDSAGPDVTRTPSRSSSFDYLYIVANEGGSSGGHVAIRFGRDVYHFQAQDGLLTLRREKAEDFLFHYALLGNRTVQSTRVAVSSETFKALRDRFRRRHRAQEAQIAVGRSLQLDRELVEWLAASKGAVDPTARSPLLAVRGLGYFESGPAEGSSAFASSPDAADRSVASVSPDEAPPSALDSLRLEILRVHGSDFIGLRRSQVLAGLRDLLEEGPSAWVVRPPDSAYASPPFVRSFSDRWRDLRAGLAALAVLDEARPLAKGSYHAPVDPSFESTPDELTALRRFSVTLRLQLVDLVASRRADWGQALLIGMARLSALEKSQASGRLVFLDSFPDDAQIVEIEGKIEIGETMLAENRAQLASARRFLDESDSFDELAWERVEERANRTLEMLDALGGGRRLRVVTGHLVPSRRGFHPTDFDPGSLEQPADSTHRAAVDRERSYFRALDGLYGYQLITRNCATAIFETLNDEFDGSIEFSQRALGGDIGGPASLSFIPFVSADQVNDRYRVVLRESIRSYRSLRIEEMKSDESPFWVSLRESNTFTARSYKRGAGDSFFVFFTERPVWIRPLFGAVNLVAALGETTVGLVMAPFDRAKTLVRGLSGTFVSLPELFFANIRKGSNAWIPMDHRILEPVPVDGATGIASHESLFSDIVGYRSQRPLPRDARSGGLDGPPEAPLTTRDAHGPQSIQPWSL